MSNIDLHNFQNDLIENDSFIRWVKSEFQEDDEYWSEFIDKYPDQVDEINASIHFVRTLDFRDDISFNEIKVWDKIVSTTGIESEKADIKIKTLFPNFGKIIVLLAAACLLLIVVFRMGISSEKEVNTNIAHQMTEALPDGSTILINSDSKIKYNPSKWKESRTINLNGTAFFKVEKGNTFTVKTELGDVTVLGTSFSITSRENIFEVICKTGKVSVRSNENKDSKVILTPGDKAVLSSGLLNYQPAKADEQNNIAWLEGVYTFEAKPLKDVINELHRQFDVRISIDSDLEAMTYTGFFRNNNIDEAIKSVTWPLGLKYKIDGKTVRISK